MLAPRGVFLMENAYGLNTVLQHEIGQIYHEHMYYYTARASAAAVRAERARADRSDADRHPRRLDGVLRRGPGHAPGPPDRRGDHRARAGDPDRPALRPAARLAGALARRDPGAARPLPGGGPLALALRRQRQGGDLRQRRRHHRERTSNSAPTRPKERSAASCPAPASNPHRGRGHRRPAGLLPRHRLELPQRADRQGPRRRQRPLGLRRALPRGAGDRHLRRRHLRAAAAAWDRPPNPPRPSSRASGATALPKGRRPHDRDQRHHRVLQWGGDPRRALDSLVQRWDRLWEIVFADNGSTDASRAIFAGHAARHPEVAMRLVDASAKRGQANATNVAIRARRDGRCCSATPTTPWPRAGSRQWAGRSRTTTSSRRASTCDGSTPTGSRPSGRVADRAADRPAVRAVLPGRRRRVARLPPGALRGGRRPRPRPRHPVRHRLLHPGPSQGLRAQVRAGSGL